MEPLLERLRARVEIDRAALPGVVVALLGCVVATLVAVRVPLLAALDDAQEATAPSGATVTAPDGASSAIGTPTSAPVVVHVAGAVARPGVVTLDGGARVADALAAAGGAAPDADLAALNLARPLVDGEQVAVPVVGAGAAGGGGGSASDPGLLHDGRLDLNAATTEQLESLPGVGPVLASRIVAHREDSGPFTEAAALREVPGIGEATWASLRELVGVR